MSAPECWRCEGTTGPFVPLDGVLWLRKGESELRPALLCAKCAPKPAKQLDMFGGVK